MSKDINRELLDEDPNSLVVETDDEAVYEPHTESSVVAVEPMIITIGRQKRKQAVKDQSGGL